MPPEKAASIVTISLSRDVQGGSLLKNAEHVLSASVVPFVEHAESFRSERIYVGNTDSAGWTVVIGSA